MWVADTAWIPELLWLWCRLAATSPIQTLAWEPPYAVGGALEKAGKKKKKLPRTVTLSEKKRILNMSDTFINKEATDIFEN